MTNEISERPIEYETETGAQIKLTMSMVRNYLVSGKGELATDQELIFFMKLCQARKLNPFLKECYLIKYDSSPAAIITARSTFQNNARDSEDCQGWKFGAIVQDENGGVRRTFGLVLENEKVVGGWFSAKPKGWDVPFELEVNLAQYIKKRNDGKPTQFWTPEKQAGMIAKVAEVQGLRALWGKKNSGLYEADERPRETDHLPPGTVVDAEFTGPTPEDFDEEFKDVSKTKAWKSFWKQAVDFHADQGIDEDKLKIDIVSSSGDHFRAAFDEYAKEQKASVAKKKKDAPNKTRPVKKADKISTAAQKKRENDLKEQAEMLKSEAWAGVEAYKDHYKDIYDFVTGGDEPQTEAECVELLDKMQAEREARESSQDAGDQIPG